MLASEHEIQRKKRWLFKNCVSKRTALCKLLMQNYLGSETCLVSKRKYFFTTKYQQSLIKKQNVILRVWKLKWPLACPGSTMRKQAEKLVQLAECTNSSVSDSLFDWEDDEKGRASGKTEPGLLAPRWTGNKCKQKKRTCTRCFLHHREDFIILLLNGVVIANVLLRVWVLLQFSAMF